MEKNNFKILVVDDEPDIVEFIAYNLKKEGYDVCTANDGLDGIKIAEKEFRIVITKDNDFQSSFFIRNKPSKLILVTTGNISNAE